MQKMWAITAITLVGFMMIISSIPQDAFAGKNTVKLSITIKNDPTAAEGDTCTVTAVGTGEKKDSIVVVKGKAGKFTVHFEDVPEKGTITGFNLNCALDSRTLDLFILIDGKNTRFVFDYNT